MSRGLAQFLRPLLSRPLFPLCVLPSHSRPHGTQMILDKKFAGTLDQGAGCLEVFEPPAPERVYPTALEVLESMGNVVDTLFARSHKVVV